MRGSTLSETSLRGPSTLVGPCPAVEWLDVPRGVVLSSRHSHSEQYTGRGLVDVSEVSHRRPLSHLRSPQFQRSGMYEALVVRSQRAGSDVHRRIPSTLLRAQMPSQDATVPRRPVSPYIRRVQSSESRSRPSLHSVARGATPLHSCAVPLRHHPDPLEAQEKLCVLNRRDVQHFACGRRGPVRDRPSTRDPAPDGATDGSRAPSRRLR